MNQYYACYKPYGVLSTFTDTHGRSTLKDFISIPGIYAAGRLDSESEGLLLLTNDGRLIHLLTDPSFGHPRTYYVQVEGMVTAEAIEQLKAGVIIQGIRTRRCEAELMLEPDCPARSRPITPHAPPTWIQLTLYEGKKHQIRHMTAAVGFPTLRLVRVAIGNIRLGNLQPGEYRPLTANEISVLKRLVSDQPRLNA
jgi:23S rRNA pseudouridine2457 synthase